MQLAPLQPGVRRVARGDGGGREGQGVLLRHGGGRRLRHHPLPRAAARAAVVGVVAASLLGWIVIGWIAKKRREPKLICLDGSGE
jgi:hypothetical protein